MKLRFAAWLLAGLAFVACDSAGESGLRDRLLRPIYADVDHEGRRRTWILDSHRIAVFAFDGKNRQYNTARSPGPENPKNFIAIPVGTFSRLRSQDVLFSGFAVAQTGSALAALYSKGFEAREGHLTVVSLKPFPVEPQNDINFTVAPDAIGPFATPEGKFLIISPQSTTSAVWKLYPPPASQMTGPNAGRVVWSRDGTQVYAADRVNRMIRVYDWPSLAPVTAVSAGGIPIDLALHPKTDALVVITSNELLRYGALPTLAVEQSVPQVSFPYRVRFSRHKNGDVLAVLNQNTTLAFYESSTLCGLDTDNEGFEAVNLAFLDVGEFSEPQIKVTSDGCSSLIPEQDWQVTFEGQVASGTAVLTSASAMTVSGTFERALTGDPILIGGYPATITAIEPGLVYFAPVTGVPPLGEPVTYVARAGQQWVLKGASAGYVGRFSTGDPFRNTLRITITDAGADPTTGDRFVFSGRSGFTPVFVSGAPSDLTEDPYGRFIVPVPDNGQARAINVMRDEDEWVIQTLYTIP